METVLNKPSWEASLHGIVYYGLISTLVMRRIRGDNTYVQIIRILVSCQNPNKMQMPIRLSKVPEILLLPILRKWRPRNCLEAFIIKQETETIPQGLIQEQHHSKRRRPQSWQVKNQNFLGSRKASSPWSQMSTHKS